MKFIYNLLAQAMPLTCIIGLGLNSAGYSQTITTSNLPLVIIDTQGQTINDEPGIICNFQIIDNASGINSPTDTPNGYNGKAKVEYRGCSSQNFPKKQLGIELRSSTDVNTSINASLLGFPAESDWVLNASYTDKTFIRDPLAYYMATVSGRYASRTKPVEVIINGQYQGIFIFQEKIKRDASRVNVNKIDPTDLGNNSITGGYIVKVDKSCGNYDPTHRWQSAYSSPGGTQPHFWATDYPNDNNIVSQQFTYIKNYISTFESVMASTTCCQATNGYPKYITDDTFIDYFLTQEIASNADAYRFSSFFSKERDSKGGKLSAGPVWDFNLAFGFLTSAFGSNSNSYEGWRYSAPGDPSFPVPFWWGKLLTCCAYNHKVVSRYQQLRQTVWQTANLTAFIDAQYALINQGAYTRNFQKWPIIGVQTWTDQPSYNGATLADEINYLKTWITNRLNWLDNNIGSLITEPTATLSSTNVTVNANTSVPLSLSFTGTAPWSYTLSSGQTGTATSTPTTVTVTPAQSTTYTIQAVSNGCGTGLQSGSVVVTVLAAPADLSLSMYTRQRVVQVGQTVELTLNLHNDGPGNASSVLLQNRLPTGLTFLGSSSTAVTASNGVISVTAESISANQDIPYSYSVVVSSNGQFWNAAQVAFTNTPDPDSEPGSGTGDGQDDMAILDIRTNAGTALPVYESPNPDQLPLPAVSPNQPAVDPNKVDMNLAIAASTLSAVVNGTVSVSLIVQNKGGRDASNVNLQLRLPVGWVIAGPAGMTVTNQLATIMIGSIAAGSAVIRELTIQITQVGSLQAQILSLDQTDASSTPGNGFTNGEKDEASISMRTR